MRTKFFLIALAIFLSGSFAANAQLTTGQTTSKVIRTGNRATAGDFGLYFGATSTMFQNAFNDNVEFTPLPLINFKYMTSDNFELRVGLEAYSMKTKLNGDIAQGNSTNTIKNKNSQNALTLYPGFAYHFSKLNILDVYVGAELPLGWDASSAKSSQTGTNDSANSLTKTSFVVGLGAFVGLQAYIADLPLALGVEYGLSSRLDAALKYKNVTTVGSKTTTVYSTDSSQIKGFDGYDFDKLSARKGELGSQIRFTLSYYFK